MNYKHLCQQLEICGIEVKRRYSKSLKNLSRKLPEKNISAALMCYARTSFRNVTPVLIIYQGDDFIAIAYLERKNVDIIDVDDINLIRPIKTPAPISGVGSEDWNVLIRTSQKEWNLVGDSNYGDVTVFLEVFDKKTAVEYSTPQKQNKTNSSKTILFPDNQIFEFKDNQKIGVNSSVPAKTSYSRSTNKKKESDKSTRPAVKINHITLAETGGIAVDKMIPGLVNLDIIDLLKMRYAIKREYARGDRTLQEFQILTTAINKTIFLKK